MSRNRFWDSYWGRTGQLLVNFSLTPVTVPEVFARVNSIQFPSRVLSVEFDKGGDRQMPPTVTSKARHSGRWGD